MSVNDDNVDPWRYYLHFNAGNLHLLQHANLRHINLKDTHGKTPLYYAYFYGHQSCIDFLIREGAETEDTLKECTFQHRLPYIQFVEGVQDSLSASMDSFCGNEDWTREMLSYIGVVDENIRRA